MLKKFKPSTIEDVILLVAVYRPGPMQYLDDIIQVKNRVKNETFKTIICIITILFSVFMVTGRLISGVHWVTDIIGSVFLSEGLYNLYKAFAFNKNI